MALLAFLAAAAQPEDEGIESGRTGILWELASRCDSAWHVAVRPPSYVDMERFRELIRRGFLTRHPARWAVKMEVSASGEGP